MSVRLHLVLDMELQGRLSDRCELPGQALSDRCDSTHMSGISELLVAALTQTFDLTAAGLVGQRAKSSLE